MIKRTIITLLLICPLGVAAQEIFSLADCIGKALESNYGIRIAKNEELMERNNQNYSSFLPSLSAMGTQKESIINSKRRDANSGTEKKFNGSVTDNYGANINLNWTIFDGLAMFTTHERLNEFIAIGELKTRTAVENLIAQVNIGYYNVLVQKSLLDAAKQSLDLSRQRYEIALQKNRIGSLSGLELKQTKIDLNSDSSTLVKQQEQLRSAYITLNTLMNIDLHKRGYVKDTILLHPMYPKDEVRILMLNNNTTLLIARREQRVSELGLKLARSAYFPSIDFSAGYSFSRTESPASISTFNQNTGPFWGFTLTVPLFNRLDTRKKVKNAKIGIENSKLSYQEVELQMLSDLAQLYNSYENNLIMVGFESESADVALVSLKTALERYRLGSLSGLEFREFQRSYLDAVTRKISAQFQAKSTEVSLLLMSGRLQVQ
ncbi:TolC family protein [Coprobacter sp.]